MSICVVPAGGLSADHIRWIKSRYDFFLPDEVLGAVFRGKFREALKRAFRDGKLNFQGDLKLLAQPRTTLLAICASDTALRLVGS